MGRDTKVNVSSVWKKITSIGVNVSGTWKDVYKIFAKTGGVWQEVYMKPVELIISANVYDVDLFTAFGSPALPAQFIYIINSGIIVGSTATTNPAINVPNSFPAGSEILITNNGQIIGAGGAAGDGGDGLNNAGITAGVDGGNSIDISTPITIDNTNGNVFGGGGGGGGGGSEGYDGALCPGIGTGGGGGGGGAGDTGGALGTAGVGPAPPNFPDGTDGTAGTTVAGTGGAGGIGFGVQGGDGGDGGEYGAAGSAGADGGGGEFGGACPDLPGEDGGLAGKAIDNAGIHVVTWLGGNNESQVKGSVS